MTGALVVGFALGLLLAAQPGAAQPAAKPARVGFLNSGDPVTQSFALDAFRRGLRELGWVEGQNLTIEYRWAAGDPDRLGPLASELARLPVDVILLSGTPALEAARRATAAIPIVTAVIGIDTIERHVASLARPGGMVTGLAWPSTQLATKQLQLLTEALPKTARIAILRHPSGVRTSLQATESAARALKVNLHVIEAAGADAIERAFGSAQRAGAGAMLILASPFFSAERQRLGAVASRVPLPTMCEVAWYVEVGCLMSYGPNFAVMWHRSASYVDRILRGTKPSDLPIEQVSQFELVINERTAKAIGFTISPALRHRADRIIP